MEVNIDGVIVKEGIEISFEISCNNQTYKYEGVVSLIKALSYNDSNAEIWFKDGLYCSTDGSEEYDDCYVIAKDIENVTSSTGECIVELI